MPRRKTTRPRRRRRKFTRRRKARVRRPILSGFPSRKLVKLRYVDTGLVLDAASGSMAQDIYRANSVFDPYQPIGGHQPMGFDQWALIYNKYTVLGAKMTMEYSPLSTSNVVPGRMGILLSSDTTGVSHYTSINNLLESKLTGSNYKEIGATINMYSGNRVKVSKTFSAKKFFGKVNVIDGSANSADVTANPGNEAFFIPWVSAIASAQDPGALNFTIRIDYIVMFHDPKNLDGS